MSMEAIVRITETEEQMRLRRAEAIAQARQIREDARRNGEALLDQVRKEAAQQEKVLLEQAEARAQTWQETLAKEVEAECAALRREGEGRLAAAIHYIVERVVKN